MDILIDTHRIRLSVDPESFDSLKTTIIFLHDSLGSIELWRDFPRRISEATNCNVLSYDRQGYGKSDGFSESKRDKEYLKKEADVLAKLIDQLGLKEVILFGHSDGGSIALLAASLYPNKIKGIITEGAHVFVENETLQGIRDAQTAYKTTNLKEKLTKYHYKNTENVFKMWTETWLSPSFSEWNIEHYLSGIQCPSLIIQGENDEYGTLDQVTSILQKTSGISESLIIPNIGHTPHKEATEIVIEKTRNFTLNL
ncbi:alpha/beta hydrolase [uncultured Aquimarina sp.]|uniref:alpha/beta fold hydrolase n=1 Tax=uncultured Aquimarina sp. TaxID=575652 RepID=UPI002625780E|nr:alpha/beta hydrolase [uncultured Aquimarina sp.]